jgi:hypothetical protein
MTEIDRSDHPYSEEPLHRPSARSLRQLCAGSPVYRQAMEAGAGPLLEIVEREAKLSDRLVEVSRSLLLPSVSLPDCPFERHLIFISEDLADHGIEEVIAFGAGEYGRVFAKLARMTGLRIHCFADNDSRRKGNSFEGCPIVAPEQACEIPHLPFVITTKAGSTAIAGELWKRVGHQNRLVFVHANSWRSRLFFDSALAHADLSYRRTVLEAIHDKSPWATAYLIANFRRVALLTGKPETAPQKSLDISPFVYQMQ